MGDLASGVAWVDGQSVDAAGLNNMVNDASVEPGLIIDKSPSVPIATDQLLFYQAGSASLKRAAISALVPVGMPAAATVGPNLFLSGPEAGSPHIPTYREIMPRDLSMAPVALGTGTVIDWSLSRTFSRNVGADTAFSFTNVDAGAGIIIGLTHNVAGTWAITFPDIAWEGGTAPTWSTAIGKLDLIFAVRIGGLTCGYAKIGFGP